MADPNNNDDKLQEDRTIYLARYDDWPATIRFEGGEPQPITMAGEVLVAGWMDQDQHFSIENFQRVAMRSHQLIDALGGSLSITGSLNKAKGNNQAFEALIYYPRLSTELEPACVESDATYPHFETIAGSLLFDPVGSTPEVNVSLTLDTILESHLNILEGIEFELWPLSFEPPSDEPYTPPKANSLTACLTALPLGNQPVTELKIRVLAEENIIISQALKTQVQTWINKACEVWYQKGGINIIPFGQILSTPEEDIPIMNGGVASMVDRSYIDIYLVNGVLPNSTNGGHTIACGTSDASVFLDLALIAASNDYILAHEIGHVLGLYHPDDCVPCARRRRGSRNSVMVPVSPINPNNTVHNLEASVGLEHVLTTPIFTTTNFTCQWSPDINLPDPVIQDIWNSPIDLRITFSDISASLQQYVNNTSVFNSNNVPVHSHPQNVNDTNFMCIRLSDCRRTRPVKLFFYLGSNQTQDVLKLLPVINHNAGPQLIFPVKQTDEILPLWFNLRKRTRAVPWKVPDGPPDSWIFAIEVAADAVPQNILNDISNFVQAALPSTTSTATLTAQHPNVLGRRITLPETALPPV